MTDIRIEELREICKKAVLTTGMQEKDIDTLLDHLIDNECSGKASHGAVRVSETIEAIKENGLPYKAPFIEFDAGNIVRMNGAGHTGPVAGYHAMQTAIQRGSEHGLVFVGIRNYCSNTGSMSYYLKQITDAGLIGIMSCNSVGLVAPPGGKQRLLGTNPIGIGVPGEGEAFIADFATSAIAYGKVMVKQNEGKELPEGVLIDQDGNPSTDPADAYNGAILPLADYRGFALGLLVELLAGPLLNTKALKEDHYIKDGLFIIVINPDHCGTENFAQQVSGYLELIRKSSKRPGVEKITIPGDRAKNIFDRNMKQESVDVAEKTLQKIKRFIEGGA